MADRPDRGAERRRKTVVLATHDLDALDVVADRCLVFAEDQTIARAGTPHEILADRELLLRANLIHERTRLPL